MKRIFPILLIILVSCDITKTVDYDFQDYQNKVVVTGFVGLGNRAELYISTSHSPLNVEEDSICKAEVSLFEDGTLIGLLNKEYGSVYITEGFIPKLCKTYSIQVKVAGFPEVVSESEMIPPPIKIDSVNYFKNIDNEILLNVYLNDPSDKNYYAIKFIRSYNDSIISITDAKYKFFYPTVVFDDKLFASQSFNYVRKLSLNAGRINNKSLYYNHIDVILFSLSKSGYQFFSSLDESDLTNGDMFTSTTEIRSNIINGFGVFAAYSSDTLKINLDL